MAAHRDVYNELSAPTAGARCGLPLPPWCMRCKSSFDTDVARVLVLWGQVDLPPLLGVDLVHCEREAGTAVAVSGGAMRLVQGELVTDAYFDGVAAEIDETLQVQESWPCITLSLSPCFLHSATSLLVRICARYASSAWSVTPVTHEMVLFEARLGE